MHTHGLGTGGSPLVLDTHDPSEAREALSNAYCPHILAVSQPRDFHAVQEEVTLGPLSIHRLSYGSEASVDAEPLASWILISMVLKGRLAVSSGGAERILTSGQTIVLDSYRNFRLVFGMNSQLLTFRFDRAYVEKALHDLRGDKTTSRVRFGLQGPKSMRAAATWNAVSSLLVRESNANTFGAGYPLLQDQLIRTAVAALADTHPLAIDAGEEVGLQADSAAVRRVMAIVEARPEYQYQVADLAKSSGLGVRALQEAFRNQLGTTPIGFIRDVRLRRAHDDLLSGRGRTVAEVADRWGFSNLGRFAAQYRERYGFPPSATLRR